MHLLIVQLFWEMLSSFYRKIDVYREKWGRKKKQFFIIIRREARIRKDKIYVQQFVFISLQWRQYKDIE